METTTLVALIVAVPVILFPAAFAWFTGIGGIVEAVRGAKARKAAATAA